MGLTRLPADLLDALRDTFATDVAERLPRLAGAAQGRTGADVLRDAHTLGSSAVVVGATEVAVAARALEELLVAGEPSSDAAQRLVEELQRWTR